MLNNIMNNALSGINIAQNSSSVISNNISNANLDGYHRQNVVIGENPGRVTPHGYLGNGCYISHVHRENNSLLNKQYNQSLAYRGEYQAYVQNSNQVDNLFSNDIANIASCIGDFFASLDLFSSDTSDKTLINNFLDKANCLVNQFKEIDHRLQEMKRGINYQIESKIKSINTNIEEITLLNRQITKVRAIGNAEPNDLLDARDNLIHKLSSVIGVKVVKQNGNYNVLISNGLPLVTPEKANHLAAILSSKDPQCLSVSFIGENEQPYEINDEQLNGGELSGSLRSYYEIIEPTYQKINKLALIFATKINEIHEKGFDIDGNMGKPFFSVGKGYVVGNTTNKGNVDFSLSYDDVSQIEANNYNLYFNGNSWIATRLPDGNKVVVDDSNPNILKFDGIELTIDNNTAKNGDSFLVKPVNNVISELGNLVNNDAKFSAAGSNKCEPSDNENIKALAELQNKKLIKGNATFTDYYAFLVNDVGNLAKQAQASADIYNGMTEKFYQQIQSNSGVNIDEEMIQMQKNQQLFNANAQVLKVTDNLFNSLMSVFR